MYQVCGCTGWYECIGCVGVQVGTSIMGIHHHYLLHTLHTPAVNMYQSLMYSSYTQNGILNMLDRNRRLKQRPERFQDCHETFDLIITVEERVYDQVVECM